ncbi:MAG TPA: hypothetical protein VJ828_09340, partial [Lacipirellulaceae bacterium]|nr:hypothetical protein [Lacipirellulaceae bacterium]
MLAVIRQRIAGDSRIPREFAKMLKTPPWGFEHLRVMRPTADAALAWFRDRVLPQRNFFLFSRGAKLGEFRP